jgi:HEAT repeat protein
MRKWRYKLLAISIVAIMGVMLTLALRSSSDPVYRGVRLSVWLQGYNRFTTNSAPVRKTDREKASEAVRHLGTNAIPRLLSMLRSRDSDSTRRLMNLLRKQHVVKIAPAPVDDRYYEAAQAFFVLGASASNAVPKLIRIYGSNVSEESRWAILDSLGYIGPAASGAVTFLLQELTNTNAIVRIDSIIALGSIRAQPEIVVPALLKYLHDPIPGVRLNAVASLGLFGKDARSATTEILGLLQGQDHWLRERAVYSLCKLYAEIGSSPADSFNSKSSEYKSSTLIDVINGLEALGTNARPAIPMLVKFLAVPDATVRTRATTALKVIDPEGAAKGMLP